MAAHRGEDEGLRPGAAQRLDDGLGGRRHVGHAAAPAADRDALAGPDQAGDVGPRHLGADGARHVVEAGRVEGLAHPRHARERDVEPAGDGDFDAVTHVGSPPRIREPAYCTSMERRAGRKARAAPGILPASDGAALAIQRQGTHGPLICSARTCGTRHRS